jgi:hypothetical protein
VDGSFLIVLYVASLCFVLSRDCVALLFGHLGYRNSGAIYELLCSSGTQIKGKVRNWKPLPSND